MCNKIVYILSVFLSLMLFSCAAPIFSSGAGVVVLATQDRSLGTVVDDSKIFAELKTRYFDESESVFSNVSVEVSDGRVLLTGTVDDPDHRITATRIAWETLSVKEVLNEIQVTDKSNLKNYAKDILISTKIKLKILKELEIIGHNYNIETVNKIVYIIGIVDDENELQTVVDIAKNTRGVIKVINYVKVQS
jgi:osmotically-inducible protein OsmY